MVEPPIPPGVADTDDEDNQRREEAAVMPGEPIPDEEPAERGESEPDDPTGAP